MSTLFSRATRFFVAVAFVFFIDFAAEAREAGEVNIQRVISPGGIEAWLVSEPSVPVLAVEIAFRGGARLEPDAKSGLASMAMSLLDEGAGDLTDRAFKSALKEKAIRMGFGSDDDALYGSLRTLEPYTDEAFELFAKALKEPRFDPEAVDRVRAQTLVAIAENKSNPRSMAYDRFYETAMGGHPYGRPGIGTKETVGKITRADLRSFHKSNIGRDRLVVSVVGPIDAERLRALLDKTFGDLPEVGAAAPAEPFEFQSASEPIIIDHDIPQSIVRFGAPGIVFEDPDFIPAFVMNYILGGGGFASRLMTEIRENRGLTYGIYTSVSFLDGGGILTGSFSTENASFKEAYEVLRDEIEKMAVSGVTDQELKDAKTYLTGSFALRFDTNAGIADQLLYYQLDEYGIDYFNRRNGLIDNVTKEDVARVAKRLLDLDKFLFVVVGQPE